METNKVIRDILRQNRDCKEEVKIVKLQKRELLDDIRALNEDCENLASIINELRETVNNQNRILGRRSFNKIKKFIR